MDGVLLAGALLLCAFIADEFTLGLLTGYIALALVALGLDLIWGYSGILSFGQAAFFGLGGYGLGLSLEKLPDISVGGAVVIGLSCALVLAFAIGAFVFFSEVGPFFIAVITLAAGVLLEQVVNQFSDFTGGINGVILETSLPWGTQGNYLFVWAIFVVLLALLTRLVRSDVGLLMLAIRDNEERLRFLGFRTARIKMALFVVSAALSAVGGILFALQTGLVSPALIGFVFSTQIVVWTAIGGRGTLIGPAVGAIAINFGQQELSGTLLSAWQLALGLVLIALVVWAPDGLYPRLVRLTRPRSARRSGRVGSVAIEPIEDEPPSVPGRADVLHVRGVSHSYGSYQALSNVTFGLGRREIAALIGPNGAGKSTLVNVISGKEKPTTGDVELLGTRAAGRDPEMLVREGLGRTFQAATVFDSISVFDNLRLASWRGRVRITDCARRTSRLRLSPMVVELLRDSGLADRLGQETSSLGHGERKWLELCMVLAQAPAVVLLDEPTAGLTEPERQKIGSALRSAVQTYGLSLVIIEHDLDFVKAISHRAIVLNQGAVVLDGDMIGLVSSQIVRDIYVGAA